MNKVIHISDRKNTEKRFTDRAEKADTLTSKPHSSLVINSIETLTGVVITANPACPAFNISTENSIIASPIRYVIQPNYPLRL